MNKKIIAIGTGIVGALGLTFGSMTPASAVDPVPTLVDAVCGILPASVTDLTDTLADVLASLTATGTDVTAKQAALTTSVNELIPAVVNHINAVSAGLPSAGTAGILTDKASAFADKAVAADAAMTASFAAQRSSFLTGLNKDYVAGVTDGLCS
jgi:hypothetical protein